MSGVLMTCWRATLRFADDRMRLAVLLTQPALWLVFLGNILDQATSRIPQVQTYLQGAPNYLSYMAPGLMVLGSIFSSAYCGIFVLEDRASGFFQKLLASPLPRASIPYGVMLAGTLQNLLQVIVFMATARLFGVVFRTGLAGILVILGIVTALNLALSALLLILAVLLHSTQEYVAVLGCVALPAVFTSTIMLPSAFMPHWMAAISTWNPLSYAVAPIRRLVNVGWIWHELHSGLAVTIGLALVSFIAVAAFYRAPRAS